LKNFVQFITEQKLRSRENMPQISDFEAFIQDLTQCGVNIVQKFVIASELEPTQNEFNDEKVKAILDKKIYNDKAIIVTSDGYILDGHHRWKACVEADDQQKVLEVDMTFENLYDFVVSKDYVEFKTIKESYGGNNSQFGGGVYDAVKSPSTPSDTDDKVNEDEGGGEASANTTAGVDLGPGVPMGIVKRKNDGV